MRVRAGILAYTLAISLVISTILTAIIILGYYHRLESKADEISIRVDRNLRSAEQIALSDPEAFDYFEPYIIDLYEEERDTVIIEKRPWGVYDYFKIVAKHGRWQRQSFFSLGYEINEEAKSALYLVDERRPLSVVGDTRIEGTVYLPQSGIQSAFINRQGYTNDSLFYGTKMTSKSEMPIWNEARWEAIDEMDGFPMESRYSNSLNLYQSFASDTLAHFRAGRININDTLRGHIWIEADRVVFDSLSSVKDIVVSAEVIEFKKGFTGTGQFLATDTIIVRQGVEIAYPSVLFVYNEKSTALLRIEQGAKVSGILGVSGDPSLFAQRLLYLEDAASITGLVYCNAFLESYGGITGHATVRKTLVNAPSAIYENYLLNASFTEANSQQPWLVPPLWFYKDQHEVLTWYQ